MTYTLFDILKIPCAFNMLCWIIKNFQKFAYVKAVIRRNRPHADNENIDITSLGYFVFPTMPALKS